MVADVMSVRTPFFASDLPKAMSGLSTGNVFHFDQHGDKLYEFNKDSRYEFAESVQRALKQVDAIGGWDQFVLLLYSLISTAWYAQKINEVYRQKTDGGSDEDLNQRLVDIIKGVSEYQSRYLSVFDASLREGTGVEPSERVDTAPVQETVPVPKFTLSEGDQARIKVYNKLNDEFAPAWRRLARELGMDVSTLKDQIAIWKRKLPKSLRSEGFGELLYNSIAFHTFSLYHQLSKFKGVDHREIQGNFESFFTKEVKLRLDQ